jgi:DNA-binding GntR family transcriptional regulator
MAIAAISRLRVRDQVRDALRTLIVNGSLEPGSRLDELRVSKLIGTSRTPLREALIALEEEGLVDSRPNHGFVVAALDERLIRDTYAILGALESAAVEMGGDGLAAATPQLVALNKRLAKEQQPARRHALDREFHLRLTEPCGNARLLALLRLQRNHSMRIDGGQRRGIANLVGSCAEHEVIVDAVKSGDLEEAARRVRTHWRHGVEVVIRWMRERK